MKKNQNNVNLKDYYVGLDIGTESVGFALTDKEYKLKKHAGKAMWGVRIFDGGQTAEERRTNRTNRRRLSRRNQRMNLLRMLFDKEITQKDAGFFMRLKESFLCKEDKTIKNKYSLFADEDFNDKDYMKKYPTIYHLRNELATSKEEKDVRLVYLAIRHIIKNRGHFLFDVDSENNETFENTFNLFLESLREIKGIDIDVNPHRAYEIITKKATKTDRVRELISLCHIQKENKKLIERLFGLIVGGTSKMADIFGVETKISSLSFDMDDEKILSVAEEIGDEFDLVFNAKKIYDYLILEKITKGYSSISEYKISEYNQHKSDIRLLKDFIKNELGNHKIYEEIFKVQEDKLPNYSAYSGYKKSDNEFHSTQQEFCKYLKSKLPGEYEENPKYAIMYQRINDGTFAPKLRKTENGIIPNSLHRRELIKILENASSYLAFLNELDENGLTVKDKIVSIFDFRIPYYVGKLKNGWAVKKEDGIIYPWNFESKVNLEASAERFITEMTSLCTYTAEDVLPKNSLLYSEFEVLNEINNIKINENPITVECKKAIYEALFIKSDKRVTKKAIKSFLMKEGLAVEEDAISGIDDTIKSHLTSYHKLKNIIKKTSVEQTEEIIKRIVLFGDDKKLLESYLKKETQLPKEDIAYVLRLKFKDWGRLSKELLNGIEAVNPETGEITTIINMLRNTNLNLMKLLSDEYGFKKTADDHKSELLGTNKNAREMVDDLYVSPKTKRAIWQTLRILDELADVEKGAPRKIFIEVARENETEERKKSQAAKRKSRKEQLIALYSECEKNTSEIFTRLINEDEERLNAKKLYLYYLQFGKCMYSGEPINLSEIDNNFKYDIDHIYPRSKIKDDSFDNLVLVKAELNREKTNIYPISDQIRNEMKGVWYELNKKGFISKTKLERLTRSTPLSEDELAQFINRQLVETRQSTKAVAELLRVLYPNTKVVYSKAGNVSHFRKYFNLSKCREINDHHHAKDAYLNIVAGNFYNSLYTKEFITGLSAGKYSVRDEVVYNQNLKGTWSIGENGTIATVKKTIAKNNVLFTVMPKEERGQLYKVTILKKGKGQVPIKEGLEIEKYGGYDKASGAFFAIVEHTEKGKKIRTIEAVLKFQKVEYESNPAAFAKKYWYEDAKIIFAKILFNSVFEIDGVRMAIRGRTGERILFMHMIQLALKDEYIRYIKDILKFLEKCKKTGEEIVPVAISSDKNLEIYDYFINKIDNSIYNKILSNISSDMKENRDIFISMSLIEQCGFLREVLKAFKCDATTASFKELCKKAVVGRVLQNKKLNGQVYLINQSVTGIFETKIDLLK